MLDSNNPVALEGRGRQARRRAARSPAARCSSISIPGTDAAISARVTGLPVELDIVNGRAANGQTKFVIGLGEASVRTR